MKFKVGEKAKLRARGFDTLTTFGFRDGQIVKIIDIAKGHIGERYEIENEKGITGFADADSLLKNREKRRELDELEEVLAKCLREKIVEDYDLKKDLERIEKPKKKRKFKKGDIVRVTKEGSHFFKVGDIVKVLGIEAGHPPIKCVRVNRSEEDSYSNDNIWYVNSNEIELI